jgi:uncharacterized repeat protein (TIGR03803 family)
MIAPACFELSAVRRLPRDTSFFPVGLLFALAWMVATCAQAGGTFTSLVSFDETNGQNPDGALLRASDGNFYGTTEEVGAVGFGCVYQLTADGAFTNIATFSYTNGWYAEAPMVQGANGDLYGTTFYSPVVGAIFKISANGTASNLFQPGCSLSSPVIFQGTNGGSPVTPLTPGSDGNFYGVTLYGGVDYVSGPDGETSGLGTVYAFTTNGELITLFEFANPVTEGANPASIVQGRDGNFYGTTASGGTTYVTGSRGSGDGTIFKLLTNGTPGNLFISGAAISNLVSFNGFTNGAYPTGLTLGRDGNFYGFTTHGGSNDSGTFFRFNPTNYALTTLYQFNGGSDGEEPAGPPTLGSDGNFYSTTYMRGATNLNFFGYGTIFSITSAGVLTTLYDFDNTNGANPTCPVTEGQDGSFYGCTYYGGAFINQDPFGHGYGTLFRFSTVPPASAPTFQNVTRAGDAVTFTWSATAGVSYQVQFASSLPQTAWSNLAAPLTATNETLTATDSIGANEQRYYRVVQLQ